MAGKLKHAKVSGVADGADTAKVRPTDWNADIRMSEGKNGQLPVRDSAAAAGWQLFSPLTTSLVNKTGGATVIGTVYVLDGANDGAFTTSSVLASLRRAVVALEAVADAADSMVAYLGPITGVKSTGTIARHRYVRLSATAGTVEDAGVTVSDGVAPPTGTVGYSIKAAAAGVVDVFWFAQTASASSTSALRQVYRGLHLRTHPDSDVAAAKVMLVRADEIVYDDGTRVTDWDREEASLAVSGAGGLDTGAEAASTWYEVWAIGKSADGTGSRAKTANDKLVLHRAKDWFKDEEQTTTSGDIGRLHFAADVQELAQGVQVDTTGKVPFVAINVLKVGSPTGNMWLEIRSDSAGSPNTLLATSVKIDVTKILTGETWILLPFLNPVSLTALTQYHLVLDADYAQSSANQISWRGATTDAYATRGTMKRWDGTAWQTTTTSGFNSGGDFAFKVYVERNDAAVTMPANYDQKALLGYAFNNGSSNLEPVIQIDRVVRCLSERKVGSFTATNPPALTELMNFVPPRPVLARLGIAHDSSGRSGFSPHLFRSDTVANAVADGAVVRRVSGTTIASPEYLLGDLPVAYQHMHNAVLDVTTGLVWVEGWEFT